MWIKDDEYAIENSFDVHYVIFLDFVKTVKCCYLHIQKNMAVRQKNYYGEKFSMISSKK